MAHVDTLLIHFNNPTIQLEFNSVTPGAQMHLSPHIKMTHSCKKIFILLLVMLITATQHLAEMGIKNSAK